MTIGACLLYLAVAFYLGYFANTLEGMAKTIVWSISLALGLLPICELIFETVRWALR